MKTIIYTFITLSIIGLSLGLGLGLGLKKKKEEVKEEVKGEEKGEEEQVIVNKEDYNKFVMNKKIPKNIFIKINNKEILIDGKNRVNNSIEKTFLKDFPDYNVKVYDDQESYEEVKSFGDDLLTICYEEIIPNAYKCDIFRLVALYKYGGIYLDSGMSISNTEHLKRLINENEMILCEDRNLWGLTEFNSILNGFIISVKENPFILSAIDKIKHNISHFNYSNNPLDITGPIFIGKVYKNYFNYKCYQGQQFSNIYVLKADNDLIIRDNNKKIVSKTKDYLGKPINKLSDTHYSKLWHDKKVFYQLTVSNWSKTAKNYFVNEEGYLCAHLLNKKGDYQFSSIQYEPNTKYKNDNGRFIKSI